MARININPKKLGLILALLVGFLSLTGVAAFVLLHKPNEFANLAAFPIDSYMEGKNLWSHEDYKVVGRVDNVIMRSASGEKLLVAIQPEGSDLRLPVLLEQAGGKISIQREQHLVLKVNLGPAAQIQCKQYASK